MTLVVDASATLAMILGEERGPDVERALAEDRTAELVTPAIWRLEVTSGLISAVRRRRISFNTARALAATADQMGVKATDATSNASVVSTLDAAADARLTPYDCAYLDLARNGRASLLSLDEDLRDAAVRSGLKVVP